MQYYSHMPANLSANIWKYTVLLVANKRIFVAILGAYFLTLPGITPQSIGVIMLAGSFAGFFFEIPSGYFADKVGHKKTLVISRILMILSTIFFLFATDLSLLILGSVFLSLSHALHSGTGSAFMHETLRGLGRDREYAKVMGKISAIGFAVPVILTVAVPFLVDISFRAPFVVALVVDLIGLLAALLLVKPPVAPQEVTEVQFTNFRSILREGQRVHFFAFALFSGVMMGMLIGSTSNFRAAYQMFLEVPVIWYGVFFGIGRIAASVMLMYTGVIRETLSLFTFYRIQIAFYALLFLVLGLVSTPWIVVVTFIVVGAFQWGLSRANESYLMDIIRTSRFKATLLSTRSQIEHAVRAVVALCLGITIERLSYEHGFLYTGIAFAVILTLLYRYLVRRHGEVNEELQHLSAEPTKK